MTNLFDVDKLAERSLRLSEDYDRSIAAGKNHDKVMSGRRNLWAPGQWPKEYQAERTRWLSSDTEESYREFGYKTRYRPDSFEYINNVQGYRTKQPEEIDASQLSKVVFLGCSMTYGIGLPVEDIWPTKLMLAIEDKTKKSWMGVNLGLPALSCDGVARMGFQLISRIKPKLVCAYFPDFARREILFEGIDGVLHRSWFARHTIVPPPGPKELISAVTAITDSEWNNFFHFVQSYSFLQSVCQANDVPLVWATWDTSRLQSRMDVLRHYVNMDTHAGFADIHFPDETRARDGVHPGPEAHDVIAELYYKKVKQLGIV